MVEYNAEFDVSHVVITHLTKWSAIILIQVGEKNKKRADDKLQKYLKLTDTNVRIV